MSTPYEAVTQLASEVIVEPMDWLWLGRIPLGELTLLSGNPDLGKSLMTLDFASRCSTGAAWPDGAPPFDPKGCRVLLLTGEDSIEKTVNPRLIAHGADLSKIKHLKFARHPKINKEKFIQLDEHMSCLDKCLSRWDARLLVIDPISSFLGKVEENSNSEVRGFLMILHHVASANRCAIVMVHHSRKATGSALDKPMGSRAWVAAARAAWGVHRFPDDKTKHCLTKIKLNIGPNVDGLMYSINSPDINTAPKIEWLGVTELTGDDIMQEQQAMVECAIGRPPKERERAVEFLHKALEHGEEKKSVLVQWARDRNISERTLIRARVHGGVLHKRVDGVSVWYWPDGGNHDGSKSEGAKT